MKLKKSIALVLTVVGLATVTVPSIPVLAQEVPHDAVFELTPSQVSPRYKYITSARLIYDLNDNGADYDLTIRCISSVTSISGKIILYKKNTSGKYIEIDSETLDTESSTLEEAGSLFTDGSGAYKITFSGTVYTDSGSEPIVISKNSSY